MSSAEALIARHEGRRYKAYKDSRGIWTIGIGHNLQVDPTLYPQLQHLITVGITDTQIDALFAHDIQGVLHGLDLHLPWWRKLDQPHQDVLQDMTFEMGVGGLMNFHHFLTAMQDGDFPVARAAMLDSAWAKEVPNRAEDDADLIFPIGKMAA